MSIDAAISSDCFSRKTLPDSRQMSQGEVWVKERAVYRRSSEATSPTCLKKSVCSKYSFGFFMLLLVDVKNRKVNVTNSQKATNPRRGNNISICMNLRGYTNTISSCTRRSTCSLILQDPRSLDIS